MSDAPKKNEQASGRRDFFGDAMREAMGPISGMIERKLGPVLRVIEELPTEGVAAGSAPKDQPHIDGVAGRPKRLGLAVVPERILRPPGALPEGEFENVCSKCGKCVEVCPAGAIKLDGNGLIADGLPYVVPSDRPCVVCAELACMKQCPSGALKLVEVAAIRMGVAKVDHRLCRRTDGEDCQLCVSVCPVKEAAIFISGLSGKVVVKKGGCIGCGICENVCPTEPRAIVVHPRGRVEVVIA